MDQESKGQKTRLSARIAGRNTGRLLDVDQALRGQTVRDVLNRLLPEAASLGLTDRRSFIINGGGETRQVLADATVAELEAMFREGQELLVDLNVAARGGIPSGGRHE